MSEPHVPLLPFHLGALDDTEHAAVDAHLLACRECLSEYLALKRRFDAAAAFDQRPSPAARERLRAEVAVRLRRRLPRRSWWAVGAAVAATLLVLFWLRARPQQLRPLPHETLIDTGIDAPASPVL